MLMVDGVVVVGIELWPGNSDYFLNSKAKSLYIRAAIASCPVMHGFSMMHLWCKFRLNA